MKKTFALLLVCLSLLLAQNAFAKGYISLGGGGGGDSESANLRFEFGGYTAKVDGVNLLFGIGIPFTIDRDDTPSDLNEYPVPHSDYKNLGVRKKGEEVGIYAKFGFEPFKDSGLYIFGLGGGTWGEEIVLARSNVTGWYYEQSKSTKSYGLFGGGLGYFPKDQRFCLHFEYDNRMGFTGNIGITF